MRFRKCIARSCLEEVETEVETKQDLLEDERRRQLAGVAGVRATGLRFALRPKHPKKKSNVTWKIDVKLETYGLIIIVHRARFIIMFLSSSLLPHILFACLLYLPDYLDGPCQKCRKLVESFILFPFAHTLLSFDSKLDLNRVTFDYHS